MRRSLLSVLLVCAPLGCVDSPSGADPNAVGGDVAAGGGADTPGGIGGDDDTTSGPGSGDDAIATDDGNGADGNGVDTAGTDGAGTDAKDTTGGPAVCGDESCTDGESVWTCAEDCGGGWFTCALEPCAERIAACKASADCAAALNCVAPCTTDTCALKCTDGLTDDTFGALRNVQQCAVSAGCFGTVPTECGNQQCEDGETAESCPVDCDKGCGNGTCDASESVATCPTDCPKSPVYTCAEKACPDELAQCIETDGCLDFDKCLKACAGDQQCSGQCFQSAPPGAPQAHQVLVQCAQDAGCFNQGPVCGDGLCQAGESCPEDCQGGPVCGDGKCETGENCPPDCQGGPVCGDGKCQPGENCPPDCQTGAVCGDGQCEPGESCPEDCQVGPGSCVGVCGEFSPNATCQCDAQCAQFNDCCADYPDVCGGEVGCGDGACDPATETPDSCPIDCGGTTDPYACIVESCGASQCTQGPKCNAALQCMAGCNDPACVKLCVSQAPPQIQNLLIQIGDCAVTQCLGGNAAVCGDGQCAPGEEQICPGDCFVQPGCGDGKCGPGESAQTCPVDCSSTGACGDGLCSAPAENIFTCPKDCSGTTIVCGDGACSAPFETAQTCPEDCGEVPGSCAGRCGEYDPAASCQCDDVCSFMGNCCDDLQFVCGGSACGDGQCDPNTEDAGSCPEDCSAPVGSCAGRCGEYDPNATCQCDDFCVFSGNCCADRDAVCNGADCGDGFCDQNLESPDTCPSDCAAQSPWQCVEQVCGFGNCPNFVGCNNALGCMESCNGNDACSKQCIAAAPNGAKTLLSQVLACSAQSGCYDIIPGPVCGDGVCDPNAETIFNCPIDCLPQPPFCGDGQCSSTETYTTCPKDCPPPQPFCGDGLCADSESYTTCPLDCKAPPTECGNKVCEAGETFSTCPTDCQDPAVCTYQKCPTEISACITDLACVQGLQCMAKCAGDAVCVKQSCLATSAGVLNPLLLNIYMCATTNQCIE